MLPKKLILLTFCTLVLTWSSSSLPDGKHEAAAHAPERAGETVTVGMGKTGPEEYDFKPADVTVNAGDTVKWVNTDTVAHTSTSFDDVWNSDNMDPKQEFSYTFEKTGAYRYFCAYHAGMEGTVNVAAAPQPTATSPPAPTTTPEPTLAPTATDPPRATVTAVPVATQRPRPTRGPVVAPANTPRVTPTPAPQATATRPADPATAVAPQPSLTQVAATAEPAPTTTAAPGGNTSGGGLGGAGMALLGVAALAGAGAAAWWARRNR